MKFIRFTADSGPSWGVIKGDRVQGLVKAPYNGIEYGTEEHPLSECSLLAPCEPSKIVCVGKNYYDHAMEMNEGIPSNPIIFIKPNTCVNHPEAKIPYPEKIGRLDYEGELAVVIGREAKNVRAEHAYDYIFGYTCLNDVTAREIQKGDGQWTRGKGYDGFAPVGPWLVDNIAPESLFLETRLNGEVKQSSNTSFFMWKIPEMIEFITACMTLLPGDVIATGTPGGIGPMKSGDVVEVEIEHIGILRNSVE